MWQNVITMYQIIGQSGEVYERLVEDSYEEEAVVQGIWEVYHLWISDSISDYNTDFIFSRGLYRGLL